jgi:hypothetical protein
VETGDRREEITRRRGPLWKPLHRYNSFKHWAKLMFNPATSPLQGRYKEEIGIDPASLYPFLLSPFFD